MRLDTYLRESHRDGHAAMLLTLLLIAECRRTVQQVVCLRSLTCYVQPLMIFQSCTHFLSRRRAQMKSL